MSIQVKNIEKHFGSFHALKHINLDVATGHLVSLLGPSGCGKTTLLRIIAGLETADSGQILLNGVDVTHTKVQDRHIGFMFQSYALFRHMSVFDNIAFGLTTLPREQRPTKAEIHDKVMHLLKLIQLPHLAKALPHQLSGGQRQRVALARSLAVEPKILLLDEPFGALDAKVRKELRQWLRDIHHELHITSLLVTHDQEEALEISDEIVVMNHGHVEQVGDASTLYHTPQTPFVTEFIGEVSIFDGSWDNNAWHYANFAFPTSQLTSTTTNSIADFRAFQPIRAYVRPHQWQLSTQPEGAMLKGVLKHRHEVGAFWRLTVLVEKEGRFVEVLLPPTQAQAYQVGNQVYLSPVAMQLFPMAS
ncbi:sulfate/molybdate ABC transporter ATP-binding protein [Pelistega europaea]|uniref:Sulfate ABC transporter ATP-binding protein n=1 Tax=Pelistega europaea TaxID=106147 RepID=A0A7Y4LB23_9BURK|nr:sulfate ABC transporter ATP-binding protein [Pelistega europaea]NOL49147.1 sulfate ABC transporter ATP-binding protein [Pelistega europaea]